jgi:hypothetical protein
MISNEYLLVSQEKKNLNESGHFKKNGSATPTGVLFFKCLLKN